MEENEKMSWGMMLRFLALVLIFAGLIIGLMWKIGKLEQKLREYENAPADTVTVIRVDTIRVDRPVPVHHYIRLNDTVTICHELKDTVKELVFLPREYMVYQDSAYRAVVSGVEPRLDSLEIYRPTITQTITKYVEVKKKPTFSISVGPGISYDGKKVKPAIQATAGFVIKSW